MSVTMDHRTREPLALNHENYLPLTDREFFCRACRSKCTETTDGVEVGHAGGCEFRPESLKWVQNQNGNR